MYTASSNYTPIDINRYSQSTRKSSTHYASLETRNKRPGMQVSTNFLNFFLIGSIVAFVLSFAYALQVNQTTTNTRASTNTLSNKGPESLLLKDKELTKSITSYPKQYREAAIPQTLVTDAIQLFGKSPENLRKEFIINRIVTYYIYRDALEENNIPLPDLNSPVTFASILDQLPKMEKLVNEKLISSANYAYIRSTFNKTPDGEIGTDIDQEKEENIIMNEWKRLRQLMN
jgi:hypothetical protein